MAQERIQIDISSERAVRELVDQVKAAGVPAVLQIDNEDVAVVTLPRRRGKRRTGVLEPNDPLLDLVGAFESNVPGGVSADKHQALRRAKRNHSA
jgi:hypothetical protein